MLAHFRNGCIGTLLLLAFFGAANAGILQVSIQPVRVCNDAGANCAQVGFFEAETDKIWAQAGIDILFRPTLQLNRTDFLAISTGTNEHVSLMAAGNAVAGNPFVTMFINMYFVDDIDGGSVFGLGCGAPIFAGVCGGLAGVIIADEIFSFNGGIGRLDTIAHEIGHVFGLTHNGFGAGGPENFMTAGGARTVPSSINDIFPDGLRLDQMTAAQIAEIFANPNGGIFIKHIPEPSSALLVLAGLFLLSRRLRAR